jgi:hypothetical protein
VDDTLPSLPTIINNLARAQSELLRAKQMREIADSLPKTVTRLQK